MNFAVVLCLMLAMACERNPGEGPDPIDPPTPPVTDNSTSGITYQLLVYSFADSNGDGIGDFNGIASKLDYLKEMGVGALWLSPIHPASSYHGYDVKDYSAVNPEYGTETDFRNLLAKAHSKGIKIYLDFVLNHTATAHPWFQQAASSEDSPYRDFYTFSSAPQADIKAGRIPMIAAEGASGYDSGQWFSLASGGTEETQKLKFTLRWTSTPTLTVEQVETIQNSGTQNSGKYLYYGDGQMIEFYSNGTTTYSVALEMASAWGVLVRTSRTTWDGGTKYGAPSGNNQMEWGKAISLSTSDPQDILLPGMQSIMFHSFFGTNSFADLNYGPAATCETSGAFKAVTEAADKWIKMGVDGFRLDVFNMFSKVYPLRDGKKKMMGTGEEFYIDGPRMHEFLKELNARSFSRYDSYTVGESYNPHVEDRKLYVDKDSHELDTIFNFGHFESDAMGKFFKKKFDLGVFKAGLFDPQLENFGKGWNTLVLENHDGSRSNARFGIDVRKYHYEASTFLPAITFLGFGTPFIYMGQEFGQTNVRFDRIEDCKDPVSHFIYDMLTGYLVPKKLAMRAINYGARDMARVPVRWDGSVNNGFNRGHEPWQKPMTPLVDVNLEKDLASEKSVFRFYQKVLEIKKTVPAAVYGDIREYGRKDKQVVAFSRFLGDEGLLVFGNFSAKKAKFTLPAELEGFTKTLLLSNYESETPADGVYELKPYEVLVYQLGK